MIKTTLHYYNLAYRDVKLNSTPYYNNEGSYQWSNGQLEILNHPQFDELRKLYSEIDQLETKKNMQLREMLAYQNPSNSLKKESETLTKVWQSEIDDEQLILKDLKTELKQFDEDMFNRGHYIEEDRPAESKPNEKKSNWFQRINWKVAFSFFSVWLLLEIFMTFIQWSSLQNDRSIEEILIRSFSLAVMLLFFHLILNKNKENKRGIYIVFITVNLLMISTMMFLPPLLFHIFPVISGSTTSAWSLTEETATTITQQNGIPSWVAFYRNNEWVPALLCSLFFMIVYFGIKKPIDPKENSVREAEPEVKLKTVQDEIREKRNHLKTKIKESENRIEDTRNKQASALTPNTTHIANMLEKLEAAKAEILAVDNKITELKTKINALLKAAIKELKLYKTEFLDILRNDPVKSSFVTPEWADDEDNNIMKYFGIKI